MEISPLKEIEKLRGEKELKIFQRNKNKHAIILLENHLKLQQVLTLEKMEL